MPDPEIEFGFPGQIRTALCARCSRVFMGPDISGTVGMSYAKGDVGRTGPAPTCRLPAVMTLFLSRTAPIWAWPLIASSPPDRDRRARHRPSRGTLGAPAPGAAGGIGARESLFVRVHHRFQLPLCLVEIGCSAGVGHRRDAIMGPRG
jgi:hypothetical protein